MIRTRVAAVILSAAVLAACGGSDDGADPSTTTKAEDATSTTKGSGGTGLSGLQNFVIGWNSTVTVGSNTIDDWVKAPMDMKSVTRGPADGGGEIFVQRLNEGAILGGRLAADGTVSSTWLGVDPNHPSAASVVQTAMLKHVDEADDMGPVAPIYRRVILSATPASEFTVAGDDAAFAITWIEGAAPGDRLAVLSMSNLTDEAAARERAAADQVEVLELIASVE